MTESDAVSAQRAARAAVRPPLDLYAAGAYAVAAAVFLLVVDLPEPVALLVAAPLLWVLPGYVLVAALFPARAPTDSTTHDATSDGRGARDHRRRRGFDGLERAALAVGVSVSVLPIVAIVVGATFLRMTGPVILAALTGIVLLAVPVAAARRAALDPADRYEIPGRRGLDRLRSALSDRGPGPSRVLTAFVVLSAVVSAGAVGFALAAPQQSAASYTDLSLMTQQGGELVLSGYPQNMTVGEQGRLTVRVANHEGESTTYVLVGELQRVSTRGNSIRVLASQEVVRTRQTVPAGAVWRRPVTFRPRLAGEDLRLVYYLYRGDAPADPSEQSAYRTVQIWIDVAG